MKRIFSNRYVLFTLFALAGLFLGWLFFHSSGKSKNETHAESESQSQIWTCSMHPQIRMHAPGKCPICGMDLIPLQQNQAPADSDAIHFTKEAAALANVMTSVVSRQNPVQDIRLYGKVQADERLIQSQVAYIPGRIEKLFVNFTGDRVQKGQPLASIYSPDLVTAQQELLEAAKSKISQPAIYEAAKERLQLWKLTDAQIADIENSGKVQVDQVVYATTSGIVTSRKVNTGDFISQGTVLFEISDLSSVWVLFDAYESDLSFIKTGDKIEYTLQAIPGEIFSAAVTFIDPVIDPVTRVSKLRIEVLNGSGKLKPEMFATGTIKAHLTQFNNKLVIPSSAVLWTGKRSIVYVKQQGSDEPVFKLREVVLGPKLGNAWVVDDGLMDGEEVVTQGTFSVDAAAQLEGKPSMMNPRGSKTNTMPGMEM